MLSRLPLSPAEREEVEDLLVERALRIRSFPRDNTTEEGRRATSDMYRRSNEPLENFLGTERYQAAQRLVGQGMYQDMLVERYGNSMAAAQSPFTDSQSDALAAIYADVVGTRKWNIRPDGPLDVDIESGLRPSDEAILGRAANVLTPEQLAILRTRFQEENITSMQKEAAQKPGGSP
jgi:hypothetical protein